jgi:hypothetical protein
MLAATTGLLLRSYIRGRRSKKKFLIGLEERRALRAELEDKTNELAKQSSALSNKTSMVKTLLEELDKQKESLGDRYPPSLYLKMRSLLEKAAGDDGDRIAFEAYFDSAHQDFIGRLRKEYALVTPGDIRLCCLLRMNLSTKEVASILSVSVRAVELRRYRLRKRLGLPPHINLVDFLIGF